MKPWPKDGEPASFEDLTRPLVRAVRFAYDLKRKNRDKDIPWSGPEIGAREQTVALPAARQLSADNLRYSEEEQGRDALEEIIGLAVQIGIEQGRRLTMNSPEVKVMEIMAKLGERNLRNIENEDAQEYP